MVGLQESLDLVAGIAIDMFHAISGKPVHNHTVVQVRQVQIEIILHMSSLVPRDGLSTGPPEEVAGRAEAGAAAGLVRTGAEVTIVHLIALVVLGDEAAGHGCVIRLY